MSQLNHCALHLATVVDTPGGKDRFGHPTDHEIVGISYIYLKGHAAKLTISCGNTVIDPPDRGSEELLEEFVARYERGEVEHLVTLFGEGFTLPVLYYNCLRYGISMPSVFGSEGMYPRHRGENNIELVSLLTNHRMVDVLKMEGYIAKLTSFPERTRPNMAELVNEKRYKTVRANLALDVLGMTMLWLRHEVVAGSLSRSEEQVILKKVIAASRKKSKAVRRFLKPHLGVLTE